MSEAANRYEAIENISTKAEKVRSYSAEISKLCDEVLLLKSEIPAPIPGKSFEDSEQFLQVEQRLFDLMAGIRANIFHLYWALTEPEIFDENDSVFDVLTSDFFEKTTAVFPVKAIVSDCCLFIKLPLLWSRYLYHTKSKHYAKSSDYLSWFDREIESALLKISDEIPFMTEKHFSYLFVISNGQMTFTDNDNYDTKHITDLVSQHLGGTDSGLTTSFSYMSVREGVLDVGTYLVVTPRYGMPPPLTSLVNRIFQVFSLEKSDSKLLSQKSNEK